MPGQLCTVIQALGWSKRIRVQGHLLLHKFKSSLFQSLSQTTIQTSIHLYIHLFIYFQGRVSLCNSLGCPGTPSGDQDRFTCLCLPGVGIRLSHQGRLNLSNLNLYLNFYHRLIWQCGFRRKCGSLHNLEAPSDLGKGYWHSSEGWGESSKIL